MFSSQRVKMPSRTLNSVCRFSQSEKSPPNHRPNVENSAALSFVEETSSHHSGSTKYSTQSQSSTVSSRLRRRSGA